MERKRKEKKEEKKKGGGGGGVRGEKKKGSRPSLFLGATKIPRIIQTGIL